MRDLPSPRHLSTAIESAIFLIKEFLIVPAEFATPLLTLLEKGLPEMMSSWKLQLVTSVVAFAILADLVGSLFAHDIMSLPCGQKEWEMISKSSWFSVAAIFSVVWLPIPFGRMKWPVVVTLSIVAGFFFTIMLIVVGIFAPRDAWDGTPVRCEKYAKYGPGSNCIGWLGIVQPC